MPATHVRVRELGRAEAEALLARNHVGSMAISFHDRVRTALVNYVYADGWIYGRMEDGPDLATLKHHHWVAFEAREVDGIYDWRTVSVNGPVELLSDHDGAREAAEFRQALERIRSVVPAVFTKRDPMPQRVQLFRLFGDEIVGREARSSSSTGDLPSA
jgi:nitroimidazol reductase NimA-like FMN-containing flavoprotein (pyridoxamine 5'-phosphate oxidase superfamily)